MRFTKLRLRNYTQALLSYLRVSRWDRSLGAVEDDLTRGRCRAAGIARAKNLQRNVNKSWVIVTECNMVFYLHTQ